ncbi:FAD-dependent oxidoreductase [Actinoplanes sp. NEAU-A12]|uniref:FAD-dependent oxidoreductase n=1 Tax=Actinoplanes sandaracinus TaxID=3045177 RepID=A0ABT6WBF6_9ACTN|nr:FAD-dependent oxidoreductase [Actinoplanes sandaracinus]MDI6097049.1 FAD-dependent oxidoreductase [Actinoplanes sandaracinus]
MQKVAIVGASLAGLAAARALRRQSFAGEIIAIGAERHQPYDRPPLSKEFLTGAYTEADLALGHDDDLGVVWRLGVAATRLDPRGGSVHLADGEEIRADGVVIATGARARPVEHAGVHTLRTLDDAIALRDDLRRGGRLVVIGAGFIGAEVASSARSLGLDVTVVESLPTPLAGPLGPEMGAVCAALHGDHGVRLLTGVPVTTVTGSDHVEAVELADGTRLPADVVVAGIGAVPNVEWLAGSGLEISGGVVTDANGATGLPAVVATGDCASRDGVRSEHWTHAVEHPATAVATLLGTGAGRPPKAPYFWSDQYGVRIQFAGRREPGDTVRIVEGDPEQRSFLAVYERGGLTTAVLGMSRPKSFTRWRRQLRAAPQEA